jgi:predicted ATP-grasp superfamily ATP-dependent carboligase
MNVLCVGASVRAAAHAAVRAGWSPIGFDRYGDRDLAALARSCAFPDAEFPEALADRIESAPPGPWLYTGPLENHPELIDRIAARRPLWGNRGDGLIAARDPFAVAAALDRAGLPRPDLRSSPDRLPRDGSWLIKPIASGGGIGVRELIGRDDDARPTDAAVYQRRILGYPASMVLIVASGRAAIVGRTAQRIGLPGLPFGYAGSVGPLDLPPATDAWLIRLADAIAASFGLVGLIGVDLMIDADGVPWPVEINPRIPASAELLELTLGRSLLADHREACERGIVPRFDPPSRPVRVVGKAIVTATTSGTAPDLRGWIIPSAAVFRRPGLADVPPPGAQFEPGDPVLTVFASGSSRDEVERRLERKVTAVRNVLARGALGRPWFGGSCHVHRI